ncbi:nitrate reductase [Mesorhizobium sp. Root157]|uniref:formylglycine-generating enzyme family protein n=1 Tax=Mesorhizobium sp. Root157 TaxID=1736477 RepID=UPI0006FF1AFB|nr:SUMF1/EgtB/PvdO family nonheme iron enzyme [Mesorhizobium sp. Root157]KQZ99890.1 nitrate reductase [Mesorhizobium sp. Root157]
MRLMIPAMVAAAAATALAIGAAPNAAKDDTAVPVAMASVNAGSFDFRLPGEYLKADWPVDAPKRKVTFRRGFEMMKYQVSLADYGACVADGACEAPDGGRFASGDVPVTGVSYRDAKAYAAWLSRETGETWRLPSDEEWAYAAAERMNDDALALSQDSANPAARWLARYRAESTIGERDAEPKPLGHFGTNSKGLADIAGNVWDWTTTCYLRAVLDDNGKITRSTENCGVRVVGGRHRGYISNFIRDGKSGGCAAGLAPDNLGIRLIRELPSLVGYVRRLLTKTVG